MAVRRGLERAPESPPLNRLLKRRRVFRLDSAFSRARGEPRRHRIWLGGGGARIVLFRLFAGFSYGVDCDDSPIGRSRVLAAFSDGVFQMSPATNDPAGGIFYGALFDELEHPLGKSGHFS